MGDLTRRAVLIAGLAQLHEHRVLGKPRSVEDQRHAETVQEPPGLAQVLERDRLAASTVVGDGDDAEGHVAAALLEQRLEPLKVDVALEGRRRRRIGRLGAGQVQGLRTRRLDVRARRVEVMVSRDHLALAGGHREQDPFRGSTLVRRYHVLVSGQLTDRRLEAREAARACVRLVAPHHPGPLLGAHGSGARVGEEVDEHVLRRQLEQVVAGGLEMSLALTPRGHAQGLDGLDLEGLDDGSEAIHRSQCSPKWWSAWPLQAERPISSTPRCAPVPDAVLAPGIRPPCRRLKVLDRPDSGLRLWDGGMS